MLSAAQPRTHPDVLSFCTICQRDIQEEEKIDFHASLKSPCYFHKACIQDLLEYDRACPNCKIIPPNSVLRKLRGRTLSQTLTARIRNYGPCCFNPCLSPYNVGRTPLIRNCFRDWKLVCFAGTVALPIYFVMSHCQPHSNEDRIYSELMCCCWIASSLSTSILLS